MDFLKAWTQLERDAGSGTGRYRLRVHSETDLDLVAILDRPSGYVGLVLTANDASVGRRRSYPATGAFRLRPERGASHTTSLVLLLEDARFRSVFGEMCTDASRWCQMATTEAEAVDRLVDRVEFWKRMFVEGGPRPLTREQQIGLFGELVVLEQTLEAGMGLMEAVDAWRGPARELHDFVGGVHMEVKTTVAPSPRVVRVSSLDQLQEDPSFELYLWHCRLESDDDGRTLAEIVDELAHQAGDPLTRARAAFDGRLTQVGYLSIHRELYDVSCWALRAVEVHLIDASFPALSRNSVPETITEAEYSLDLRTVRGGVGGDPAGIIMKFVP